jgi:redox-sensitive bicupin YhaK (pirin superfamily)
MHVRISGYMEHRDGLGQGGQLAAGSARWMTAGHGTVHSEMPSPVVVAGRKIGESVARRGPFVMNTQAELEQAYEDFRNGVLVSG